MIYTAWLHRRGGPPVWTFVLDPAKSAYFLHTTRYGNTYAIIPGPEVGKPFWIGRRIGDAWCTWEGRLGARYIEFEGAGNYFFDA